MSSQLRWSIIKQFASKNVFGFAFQDVVTKKQTKPAIRSLGGITYQFIQHDATRFFGFSSIWINQLEKAMVSDLKWTTEHERMMVELGTGISLLDPAAPDQGRKRKKFGLKINVDPILIKEKVLQRKMS